jgi:5-methylcytosine-specific restriction protein A
MAKNPPKACIVPGCPNISTNGTHYCDKHLEERKKEKRNRREHTPAAPFSENWPKVRAKYLREHPYCEICGRPAEIVHHKIDRRVGGTDHPDNLQALCNECHSRLHMKRRRPRMNPNKHRKYEYDFR